VTGAGGGGGGGRVEVVQGVVAGCAGEVHSGHADVYGGGGGGGAELVVTGAGGSGGGTELIVVTGAGGGGGGGIEVEQGVAMGGRGGAAEWVHSGHADDKATGRVGAPVSSQLDHWPSVPFVHEPGPH